MSEYTSSSVVVIGVFLVVGITLTAIHAGAQEQDATAQQNENNPVIQHESASQDKRTTILASDEMREALKWVRNHVRVSLVHQEGDLKKLETRIKSMSADDLEEFLVEVKEYRKLISSDEWQEMRSWMKEFLRVQARISDTELEEFCQEVAQMSPDQLRDLLVEFQMERSAKKGRHARETQAREQRIQSTLAQQQPLPATGSRGTPTFGGASPPEAIREFNRPSSAPRPTITASDYARRRFFRRAFGRRRR